MLQEKSRVGSQELQLDAVSEQKQRRRMLLALVLLVVAVAVVLIKDRRFWFRSGEGAQSDADVIDTAAPASVHAAARSNSVPAPKGKKAAPPVAPSPQSPADAPFISTSNRTALPPLEVEVVAGDSRHKVRPGNTSVKVDLQPDSLTAPAEAAPVETASLPPPSTTAAQRVVMSADTTHAVERSVEPSYPLLARQMKVQGSVVLQALIGNDGLIQDLRVVSGPTILASAAREAVRQWRFKPYLQAGKPVETEAKITVNFTISTF